MRRLIAAAVLVAALSPGLVLAKAMLITASHPAAKEMVDSQNGAYWVRFDGPVDHRESVMSITGVDGKLVEVLHPLLDSATNVLYARGPRLTGGDYQLHWSVRSMPDGEVSTGYVPFSVKG